MKPELYLIRGISGSGKTTLAHTLHSWFSSIGKSSVMYSADDYFTNPTTRVYYFNPEKLKEAHEQCQLNVDDAMYDKIDRIIVHNTFTRRWEIEPYLELARKKHDYEVFEMICSNRFQNIHAVPDEKVKQQLNRFEM